MPIIILIIAAFLALNSCAGPVSQVEETVENIEETIPELAEEVESALEGEATDETETAPTTTPTDADGLLDQIFITICESDYLTVHDLFIDPEAYGIDLDKTRVTLGSFLPDEEDEELIDTVQGYLDSLEEMSLDEEQQLIVSQLQWEMDLDRSLNQEQFNYLPSIWTVSNGQQKVLFEFFSMYQLYSEDDLPYLLLLLEDMDRYIQEARMYTAYQAENGLLRFDRDEVMAYIDEVLSMQNEDPIGSAFTDQIEDLGLDTDEENEWIDVIQKAVEEHFYPAYDSMKRIIQEFEKDNQPFTGLANLPNGADYYELLLQYNSGTSNDAATLEEKVESIYNSGLGQMQNSILSDSSSDYVDGTQRSGYTTPEEILEDMESNYGKKFPKVGDLDIVVEPMSDLEARDTSVLAYMTTTPVDYTGPYHVYYNSNTSELNTIDFFETMVHESVPGHVYKMVWGHENAKYPVSYLLFNFALNEGWANYAAALSLEWSDLTEEEAESYLLSERLNNMLVLEVDLRINYYGDSFSSVSSEYGISEEGYNQLCESPGIFFAYYYGQVILEEFAKEAQDSMGSSFDWVSFNEMILNCGNINFDLMGDVVEDYIGS